MRKGSVAIIGCGWLGFPLAKRLLAAGYEVRGTTTSQQKISSLQEAGIEAYLLTLPVADISLNANPVEEITRLWCADQLVLCLPPGRNSAFAKTYPASIMSAVLAFRRNQPSGRILFTSSTGVYGDMAGEVDEKTSIKPTSERQLSLLLAEAQVAAQSQRPYQILRLGGLYGGERHPGKYLAGRKDIPNGDAPINLVSRDRVIEEIHAALDHPFWTLSLKNVVDPEHLCKRDYYSAYAKTHHLPMPTFLAGGEDGKVVKSLYV